MTTERIAALDWARVVAAQVVFASHLHGQLFPAYTSVTRPPIWFSAEAFIAGFAGWAVIVFFVISGWQVGGQLIGKTVSRRAFAEYALDRVARFGCVLVPLIALSQLLYELRVLPADSASVGVRAAITNLLSMQGILGPQFAGDFPLWSLTNEWCYYFCGALLAIAITMRRIDLLLFASALASLYVYQGDLRLLTGGLLWVIAASFARAVAPHALRWLAPMFFVVAIVTVRWLRLDGNAGAQLIVGVTFLCAAVTLRETTTRFDSVLRFQPYTFSLYVVHAPLLAIAKSHGVRASVDATGLTTFLAMFAVINAIAALFYWGFERRYHNVRRWLKGRVLGAATNKQFA